MANKVILAKGVNKLEAGASDPLITRARPQGKSAPRRGSTGRTRAGPQVRPPLTGQTEPTEFQLRVPGSSVVPIQFLQH